MPAPDGVAAAAARGRPGGVRAPAAGAEGRRGHRHDLPRRPPVAARDPGPHPRPALGRRPRRPHHAAAVVARGVGRRDVRRRAALPRRGPVGAAGRAAPGGAEHLPPDAAARAQHGRLHAVPDRGDQRVRRGGRGHRHRRVPHLRRAQRRRADAARRSRRCARPARRSPRSRSATPATSPTRTRRSTRSTTTCELAERIVDAGAHVLAIKDMAGLLRAPAARTLVTALRERFDLPVHLHTHDTPGGQLATLLAAIDAGVDAVDAATASMAGTTSQPPLSALVSATDHGPRETGLDAGRGLRAGALLGGDPPGLRAVRVRAARRRPVGSTATRSPAASSPTCASRRSRSASARSSSRSRTCTPPPTTSSATSSR